MSIPLFDHHVHLDDERTPAEFIQSGLDDPRLVGAVSAGYGPERSDRARAWLARDARLSRTVGLHPWWLAHHSAAEIDAAWSEVEREAQEPGVVALGEMGLDQLTRKKLPLDAQRAHFERALAACQRLQTSAVLHVVRWPGHALEILRATPPPGGVLHRYGGPGDMIPLFQALGLHISVDTTRWRQRPEQVAEIVRRADPELLLAETDWPLKPHPWSEALDELEQLVHFIAECRGEPRLRVAERLVDNARKLYGVSVTQ